MLTIVNNKTGILTQVDDSGQWIPKDPSGKMQESQRILQEPAGNHWKKSENFPAGKLLPQNHRNFPEPAVSGSDCSTWDLKMWSINYN
jgi:hypothetical protein